MKMFQQIKQNLIMFILTSLLALDNLYVAVHGGSKSSKASSKTTVIAIDGGGGGGGKPHPVPIPWPVVHCHHHHHHLKYVPKPVLVHHWVKKGRGTPQMVEDFAATSFEKQQVPLQLMEHQETLQLPESSNHLIQESDQQMEHDDSSMLRLNAERPYALASGDQLPMASAFADEDRLVGDAMTLSASPSPINDTSLNRMSNSTTIHHTNSNNSNPFKSQFGDHLRDESSFGSNFQAKLNKLNAREQAEAKRTFDRFATEQASKLIALQAFNQALIPAIKHINSHQAATNTKTAQSGAGLPLQVDSRTVSESRAIELVTKLAEQLAQAEAKRMLLRVAAAAQQRKFSGTNSNQKNQQQQQKLRRNSGGLFSIFGSSSLNENLSQPKAANKRKAAPNALQLSAMSALPFLQKPQSVTRFPIQQHQFAQAAGLMIRPARHLAAMKPPTPIQRQPQQQRLQLLEGDQLATEASRAMAKMAEPAPGDATTESATPPQSTTPASTSTTVSAAAKTLTTTPTTMSPEQESNFYLSQHQHLFGHGFPQTNVQMLPDGIDYFLEPLLNRRPREQPHQVNPSMARYKWQASDVHNLIAEAPQHLLAMNNSQALNTAASFSDQFQLMAPGNLQQPQQYLRDLDPFSAHSFASLITKTPQELSMEQQQQQMFPQLASPYLEFPLTPEKWSADALRSVNMNFNSPTSDSSMLKPSASALQELVEQQEPSNPSSSPSSSPNVASSQPEELQAEVNEAPFTSHFPPATANTYNLQQHQQVDPLLSSSQQLSASGAFPDPIVTSAAADMQSMRQLQANLAQQQQQLGTQQSNFTAMTRLSRQLRDQMRTFQNRLPQMPQVPNIPQPPQVPQLPPGVMQMASMALPFALARATRSSRDRQTQQVNAAAQGGGTTAGATAAAPGVRQRILNRALALTNRLARPRPRRPANTPTSQQSQSSPSAAATSQRNPRQRLFGVVRTVIDMSRRPSSQLAPPGARRPLSPLATPAIRPKIDEGGGGGRRLASRVLVSRAPAIAGRMSSHVDRNRIQYMPSTVMTTLTDGSLASFPSMTSPLDLLNGVQSSNLMMDADWPRIRPATTQTALINDYELRNQQHQHQLQLPQQPTSNRSVVFNAYSTNDLARHLTQLPTSHKLARVIAQKHPPLVANHINLLLITAQNVTQGSHHHHNNNNNNNNQSLTSDSMNKPNIEQAQTELPVDQTTPETPVAQPQPTTGAEEVQQLQEQPKEEEEAGKPKDTIPAAEPSQMVTVRVPARVLAGRRRLLTAATPKRRPSLAATAATPPPQPQPK